MTDPKPPRPFPPPLPGSLEGEPFPKAKSDPPWHMLSPPDRNAVTPPSGGMPIYDPDPRDGMIRDLQAQLVLLREQLDAPPETPVPLTRPSVRVRRAQLAKLLGKWTILLTLLPLVGGVVAKRWPEYSGIVDTVLQLVGLK